MRNDPCHGCWWIEGGRCFNVALLPIHGLEKMPRDAPLFSGQNGLELSDRHISACVALNGRKAKSSVLGAFFKQLRSAGFSVETMSPAEFKAKATNL